MGYIISKHLKNNSDFTRDELIVCKALENANDYDLENFEKLMKNCIKKKRDGGIRIKYDSTDLKDIIEYELTCDWCVYNRIFRVKTTDLTNFEDMDEEDAECLELSTYYCPRETSNVLVGLIDDVKQIWRSNKL